MGEPRTSWHYAPWFTGPWDPDAADYKVGIAHALTGTAVHRIEMGLPVAKRLMAARPGTHASRTTASGVGGRADHTPSKGSSRSCSRFATRTSTSGPRSSHASPGWSASSRARCSAPVARSAARSSSTWSPPSSRPGCARCDLGARRPRHPPDRGDCEPPAARRLDRSEHRPRHGQSRRRPRRGGRTPRQERVRSRHARHPAAAELLVAREEAHARTRGARGARPRRDAGGLETGGTVTGLHAPAGT